MNKEVIKYEHQVTWVMYGTEVAVNENGHVESVSKEGWELVCANEIKQFSTGYTNFYWKRPI